MEDQTNLLLFLTEHWKAVAIALTSVVTAITAYMTSRHKIEINEFKAVLQATREYREQLKSDLLEARNEREEGDLKLRAALKALEKTNEEVAELRRRISLYEEEIQLLRDKIRSYEQEIAVLTRRLIEYDKETQRLRSIIDKHGLQGTTPLV
jgi:chromosome segregation ATPase